MFYKGSPFFLHKNKEENPLLAQARIFPSEKQGGFYERKSFTYT